MRSTRASCPSVSQKTATVPRTPKPIDESTHSLGVGGFLSGSGGRRNKPAFTQGSLATWLLDLDYCTKDVLAYIRREICGRR